MPGDKTRICNVICRCLFCESRLIVLLILVELMRSLFERSVHVMIINVCTLILRIFTDLHTCLQGSESIVLTGKDTMTPVLRFASPYRGLDTYAHIHKYLGERVV